MKLLSLLTIIMAVICCVIPNIIQVHEEVDYYILSVLCVIAGIVARIEVKMGQKVEPPEKNEL